jgi:hypothetical protein
LLRYWLLATYYWLLCLGVTLMKSVLEAFGKASSRFFRNWRALITFIALDAALILALYEFFATREATVLQVIVTFLLPVVAVVLFFILQAMGVQYMQDDRNTRTLMKTSLKEFWKLMVVSVPFICLAWLAVYLLGKIHVDAVAAARTVTATHSGSSIQSQPIQWEALALSTLQFLLLYVVIPVAAVNLWIASARDGLGRALKGIGRALAKAFKPGSVVIYVAGMLVFGVIPYLLVSMTTHSKNAWVEFGLLVSRLAVAALLSLFGLIITLGALTVKNQQQPVASSQ